VSSVYAWLSRHPRLVDGVLALVLALVGTASAVGNSRQHWLALPLALFLVGPVIFRRKSPVAAFAVAVAAGAMQVLTNIGLSGSDLAIVVLLYTLAAYRPRRISVAGLAVCLLGSAVAIVRWAEPPQVTLLQWIFIGSILFAGPSLIAWVLGDSMRYRRAYLLALEDRAARLEAERDAQALLAAAAERARIARELHDVIAHNVSVMVVQADGASYALQAEPERARQALAAISRTGRQALSEMRRLLGVLRAGDERAELAPLPGLDQLRELLDQARSAGMSVSLTMEGPPRPLDEGAELAAYRAVQESLTNTRKHGGLAVAATVTLRYEKDGLLVQVTDDGRSAPAAAGDAAGHGLTGMRERIALYGGTVQAGPLAGGGYQVSARLPFAGPAPQDDAGAAGAADSGAADSGAALAGHAVRRGDAA
jgi:signal transduction histidine kinase